MKAKTILVGIFSLSMLMACKIDNKENNVQQPTAQPVEPQSTGEVTVVINAIVPANDNFQLFYGETASLDFDQNMVVPVTGKPEAQDITFNLPDDALPATVRIDPGDSKTQGKLTFNSVTIKYYDKSFVVKGGEEFLKYLQPGNLEKVASDATSITFVPKQISDGGYDPMFYPSGDLLNALHGILVK
ncbi:hypothetical protein ACLI09_00720 [Flavobacterium sp. RHBU_24]|uniref:hypothetical protein n=1 Tax=Flavobacterium sp. RHBU_24 TaxID=3391185 RepID=UPI00398467EA